MALSNTAKWSLKLPGGTLKLNTLESGPESKTQALYNTLAA